MILRVWAALAQYIENDAKQIDFGMGLLLILLAAGMLWRAFNLFS